MRLQGKVALITGAASGIGLATTLLFVREGARVMAIDRDGPLLERRLEEPANAGEVLARQADVTREADLAAAFDELQRRLGGPDIVYANAGVAGDGTALETSLEHFERVTAINLSGVFLTAREAVRGMQGRGGSLILQGSISGLVGMGAELAYEASKGGVHAMTRALAIDHAAQGIRVNAICPGVVMTPMVESWFARSGDPQLKTRVTERHPLGRLGTPADIANLALYLASDESAWMTGASLVIDGGYTAR
jgi:NAD(P)-dependent dehydrogenase (short-subunit alcohol dehydrogenase family)